VVPLEDSTMADLAPMILLKRDDFPTFGLPTMTILGKLMFFILRHFIIIYA
jgi:hypothetical protein